MALTFNNAGKLVLRTGGFASFNRSFTEEDIKTFGKFVQDYDQIHFKKEAFAKLGFEKTFGYGMMTTSLVTKLYLSTFKSLVYVSLSAEFLAPVYVDEEIEIKFVITDLQLLRNKIKCGLEATALKIEKNQIAVKSNDVILLGTDIAEIGK